MDRPFRTREYVAFAPCHFRGGPFDPAALPPSAMAVVPQAGACPVPSRERVNRGGSWNNNSRNLRSAIRNRNNPDNRNNNLGFRVARTPSNTAGAGAFTDAPGEHQGVQDRP
ncbi:MAG: SUMF1/EgtB/PvdO family nonheme iron enzyme [Rhodospirillales bacterium]|nr:SUMF1/EgtB/PvdO family nonheme iron enzyme [Rhodospirillales bacterium]